MPRLLVVETSPRGDHSISRALTGRFVDKWSAAHPGGEVVERDLMRTDLERRTFSTSLTGWIRS